jgi:hypothetical protein
MLALYGPLLASPSFQLVVSGINRGDNCGLHVIYSGTVGAAREAACKANAQGRTCKLHLRCACAGADTQARLLALPGRPTCRAPAPALASTPSCASLHGLPSCTPVPAQDVPSIAVSLDNYLARTQEQYEAAATYTLALIKAVLGVLPAPRRHTFPTSNLAGRVINVNGECVSVVGWGRMGGVEPSRKWAMACTREAALPWGRPRACSTPAHPPRRCSAQGRRRRHPRLLPGGTGGALPLSRLAGALPPTARLAMLLTRSVARLRSLRCPARLCFRAHGSPTCCMQEMDADPHYSEGHAGAVTLRAFRNAAGSLRGDLSQGCDSWAVGQGWVAVTPLALRSGARSKRMAGGGGGGAEGQGGTAQDLGYDPAAHPWRPFNRETDLGPGLRCGCEQQPVRMLHWRRELAQQWL